MHSVYKPCHDPTQDSLDFQKETLDHLEFQGFFTGCMEEWIPGGPSC